MIPGIHTARMYSSGHETINSSIYLYTQSRDPAFHGVILMVTVPKLPEYIMIKGIL